MKKSIIGIVQREYEIDNEKIIGVRENYIKKINKNGAIPLIITNCDDLKDVLDILDGIIIPGGIEGKKYDYIVRDYAIKNNIPLLGICLGMQVIVDEKISLVKNHYLTTHKINLTGKLKEIYKIDSLIVNSRHNYKIDNVQDYNIVAKTEDGIIEAIEKGKIIAVQYHPEDLEDDTLFNYFIELTKKDKN